MPAALRAVRSIRPGRWLLDGAGSLYPKAVTIRGKIFLAFCALAAITAVLGISSIRSVVESGRLVAEIYDKPLMAISYARYALSQFTEMELLLAQWEAAHDPTLKHKLELRSSKLAASIFENIHVAKERALSPEAANAATDAASAVAAWEAARRKALATGGDRTTLYKSAITVKAMFDHLVERTTLDGFRHRERALQSINDYRLFSVSATVGALLLAVVVTILLARQMIRPIAVASHAASRIAEGELEVEIGSSGNDELGRLLGSMALMRDNIRTMMQREIEARRSAQVRLINAIERSDQGVILTDRDHRMLIWNSQISNFFHEIIDAFVVGACLPLPIELALTDTDGEIRTANGQWLRLSRSPTDDDGFVIVCSDITVLKEREASLRIAKDQAEAASQSKSEFLTHMSHELRTPLNAILGFSEVIRDSMVGPLSKRYRDYARDIYSAGSHLLSLINDLLDLSKIEVGRMELDESEVDVEKVMSDCHQLVAERAQRAGLSISIAVEPNLPLLRADARRINQVVLNLLSNAIKFTPAGGTIAMSAGCTDHGDVAIAIADTGIGMRPEDVPIALEAFRQIDRAMNRRYEGTGLGLPMVQQLVQLHGGSISIDTSVGKGTTVRVFLPKERCIELAEPERLPAPTTPDEKRMAT